jgi:hypothetical protein
MALELPETDPSDLPTTKPEGAPASDEVVKAVEAKPPEMDGDEGEAGEGPKPEELNTAGLRKALDAERKLHREAEKKRKEAERRIAEFEGYRKALEEQRQAKPEKEADPDEVFFKDTRGYVDRSKQEAIAEAHRVRFETLEEAMRLKHDDYDDTVNRFVEMARSNPAVLAQYSQAKNQPRFAYEFVKNQPASADELRKKIRAEVMAELGVKGDEDEDSDTESKAPATKPTKSLATARGAGPGVTQGWKGPRSSDELWRQSY